MIDLTIKPATSEDSPFVTQMMALSMHTIPELSGRSGAELALLAGLENGRWQSFVAWWDAKPVGAVWLRGEGESNARHYTLGLAVAVDWQNLGVGTALLRFALDYSRQNGGRVVGLKVSPTNQAALRLYRRLGFEESLLEMKFKLDEK